MWRTETAYKKCIADTSKILIKIRSFRLIFRKFNIKLLMHMRSCLPAAITTLHKTHPDGCVFVTCIVLRRPTI